MTRLGERLETLRSRPQVLALVLLVAVAVVVGAVVGGSALFAAHPQPWFPDLYAANPPAAGPPPGPGTYLRAPVIQQAYPLDCESAALQSALAVKGIRVSQKQIFDMLPQDAKPPVLGADGSPTQWGNPYKAFVGDVQGQEANFTGYGVYSGPIAAAAAQFGAHADTRTGWTVSTIEQQISQGNPVVVWVDANFRARQLRYWKAWDGAQIPYIVGEHAVTVMGFDPAAGTITVVDVLRGQLHTFTNPEFAAVLSTFGGMGIAISLPSGSLPSATP
jgi:uncharacterized protein YvpB